MGGDMKFKVTCVHRGIESLTSKIADALDVDYILDREDELTDEKYIYTVDFLDVKEKFREDIKDTYCDEMKEYLLSIEEITDESESTGSI